MSDSQLPIPIPGAGWFPDPENPNGERQRYWDGNQWTQHYYSPDPPLATKKLSRKERKELEKTEALRKQHDAARAAQLAIREQILDNIDAARTFEGGSAFDAQKAGFILDKGERVYGIFEGAPLIEIREGSRQIVMTTGGFRYNVSARSSVGVSQTRGEIKAGQNEVKQLDFGDVAVTDKRILFVGPSESREWLLSKLTGMYHDTENCWTALAVSNRQKVSGFGYTPETAREVQFRIVLALAIYQDAREELAQDLEKQLDEFDQQLAIEG